MKDLCKVAVVIISVWGASASAQTTPAASPSTAVSVATPVPKDATTCMAMLNDLGPRLANVTDGKIITDIKQKGAHLASLCQQQKFQEAALTHDAILIALVAKK
jgi:hypothetical protein